MQTDIHFWSYLAQFFLEWEMFQINVVEKVKTHILCSVTSFRKSYRLWDNVENPCKSAQATDVNRTRRMRIACWIPKAAYTHSQYVVLIAFPLQQWLHGHASMLRYRCIDCLLQFSCCVTPLSQGHWPPPVNGHHSHGPYSSLHSKHKITSQWQLTRTAVLQAFMFACGLHIVTTIGVSTLPCLLQFVA
jgi:hypothetical protein